MWHWYDIDVTIYDVTGESGVMISGWYLIQLKIVKDGI